MMKLFSNSYFRAFVLSVLTFVAVLAISYQKDGLDSLGGRRGGMFASLVGITLAIAVALVGTFFRGEKPCPWPKMAFAFLVCWVATVVTIAFLVFVFIRPR